MSKKSEPLILLSVVTLCFIVSGIAPYDRITWLLEVSPIFIGMPILLVTYQRFTLTPIVYRLIFLHSLILIMGSHYTYSRVPLGFWIQDLFHFSRNHYDRFGHFAQGFIPAILVREILIRLSPLKQGKWLFFLVVSVCLAFSAFYEILEWWAAVIGGDAATTAFLGTQGDVWDTQWDMFFALIGSITAQMIFNRIHNRALDSLRVGM